MRNYLYNLALYYTGFGDDKTILTTRYSSEIQRTLTKDPKVGTELVYGFKTEHRIYTDGSSQDFLVGTMSLRNVQTKRMWSDDKTDLRMTVGWRNPQEDSYDLTSVEIRYN